MAVSIATGATVDLAWRLMAGTLATWQLGLDRNAPAMARSHGLLSLMSVRGQSSGQASASIIRVEARAGQMSRGGKLEKSWSPKKPNRSHKIGR